MVSKTENAPGTSWQICLGLASTALVTACLSFGSAAAEELNPQQQLAHDIYKELIEKTCNTILGKA